MAPIRLLTYNIRLALEKGVDEVVATIKHINADMVALQEVGDCWPMGPDLRLTEEIATAAGYPHSYFAGALFEGNGAYGIGLVSRWAIANPTKTLLPRTVDEQRVILRVRLPEIHTSLWTTHLSVVKQDRDKQIRWLLTTMRGEKPDIFLGDLNTSLSDPGLTQIPMKSSFMEPAPATYPAYAPTQTIDHILYGSRFSLHKNADVYDSQASDHLPVFAELKPVRNDQ